MRKFITVALCAALLSSVIPAAANTVATQPPQLRAVCDNNNVAQRYWWCEPSDIGKPDEEVPGTLLRGRVDEGLKATNPAALTSTDPEINAAFELLGDVSGFYWDVAKINLTELIGLALADGSTPRALSATVNACMPGQATCGEGNAYWINTDELKGQYVGGAISFHTGLAKFADVVAHEMSHGVIDALMPLSYEGESGAITEGIADVLGELADRWKLDASETLDSDDDWLIGEGKTWRDTGMGFLRDMSNPGVVTRRTKLSGQGLECVGTQPSTMTDPCWDLDGDVHTNGGVVNKTAYLITMGGTFNGITVAKSSDKATTLIWLELLKSKRLDAKTKFATFTADKELPDGSTMTQTYWDVKYYELGRGLIAACRTLAQRKEVSSAVCEKSVIPAVRATGMVDRTLAWSIPSSVRAGSSARVSATVVTKARAPRPLAGQEVLLQRQDPRTKKWLTLSTGVTGPSGTAAFALRLKAKSQVRVVLSGYDGVPGATSTVRSVSVR